MLNKNERTMEAYVEAGACARLLTEAGTKAAVSLSKILPAKDSDRIVALLARIEEVISRADDQLFRDYPGLGHEGTCVFYGPLSEEPESELDEEVLRKAKAVALSLFGSGD